MPHIARRLAVFAALAGIALSACGGGGGSAASGGPPPVPTPTPGPPATVNIAIVIPPPPGTSSARRAPHYVSPATATISISVNGGAAQTFAVSSGSPCSSPPAGSGTCRVFGISAPSGSDTFAVTLLDASNHVLSQGSTTATIVPNTTNTLSITFDGVVASLAIALPNPPPPQGSPARMLVSLLPRDADGYTIVGAPGALPSITVSDADTSSATTLYLGTDTTCANAAGPSGSTVTATQSGTQYTPVCLAYTGAALPNGATLTATTSGVPSATATFRPAPGSASPSGVWVFGQPPSGGFAIERYDANLNLVTAMSGPGVTSTFSLNGSAQGIGASSTAVTVGSASRFVTYPANGSGDVTPVITTVNNPGYLYFAGPALDENGNAYYVISAPCTIYRVPLQSGTQTAVPVADCTSALAVSHPPRDIRFNGPSELYVLFSDDPVRGARQVTIVKYRVNADGSLTPVSAIQYSGKGPGRIGFDPSGVMDVLVFSAIDQYPRTVFVDGQTTTVTEPAGSYTGTFIDMAVDPVGDVFVIDNTNTQARQLRVFPAGSRTETGSANINPMLITESHTASGSGSSSSLQAQPSTLNVPQNSTISVSESGYTSTFTHTDDCAGKATISPASASGPNATFTVTPGSTGGTCTVTFYDAAQHTAQAALNVTAIVINGQSKRRSP